MPDARLARELTIYKQGREICAFDLSRPGCYTIWAEVDLAQVTRDGNLSGRVTSTPIKVEIKSKREEESLNKDKVPFEKTFAEGQKLLDSDPLTAMSLISMACCAHKRHDDGIRILKEFVARTSNEKRKKFARAEALVIMQGLYIDKGNHQKGMQLAKEISKDYPDTEHDYWAMGNLAYMIYEKKKQWEKAESIYRNLIQRSEKSKKKQVWLVWPYIFLGNNLYHQKKFNDAISSYQKGLDMLHRYKHFGLEEYDFAAEAQFMIGQSYRKLGKTREAKEAYQKVLDKYVKSKKWSEKARLELTKY